MLLYYYYYYYLKTFSVLEENLISAPIVIAPNWSLPFELMCDVNDIAIRVVLGKRKNKVFQIIYYVSHALNDAQRNYTTTEKELLAIVFPLTNFNIVLYFLRLLSILITLPSNILLLNRMPSLN